MLVGLIELIRDAVLFLSNCSVGFNFNLKYAIIPHHLNNLNAPIIRTYAALQSNHIKLEMLHATRFATQILFKTVSYITSFENGTYTSHIMT